MAIKDPYPMVLTEEALERRLQRLFAAAQPLQSGSTSQRPNRPPVGTMYFDTTLRKPVWWNGKGWQDATGASV